MSSQHDNASQRFIEEENIQEAEAQRGSSSTSSDGTSRQQQNQLDSSENNPHPMISLSMPQSIEPFGMSSPSNAQYWSTPTRHQPVEPLPLTPAPGTPESVIPAAMEFLPQTGVLHPAQLGGCVNLVTHDQPITSPQQHAMQNEQLLLSLSTAMVNPGSSQDPVNWMNPYSSGTPGADNYYFPMEPPPPLPLPLPPPPPLRPQVPMGPIPPRLIVPMVAVPHHYQQMSNSPGLIQYGPQGPHHHAAGCPIEAPPYNQFVASSMPNPQMEAIIEYQRARPPASRGPSNQFSQGLANRSRASSGPSTSAPRCTNSVYDPAYEEMGLPIDPHLRMFLASLKNDDGGKGKNHAN